MSSLVVFKKNEDFTANETKSIKVLMTWIPGYESSVLENTENKHWPLKNKTMACQQI
jgi:hypothetical protein